MNFIQINKKILKVLNGCHIHEFTEFMDMILSQPDYEKYFKSKLYLWNWIRPRDIYKMSAIYISNCLNRHTEADIIQADKLIKILLATTKDEKVKQNFAWNIMKNAPILSMELIPYASPEKIHNFLTTDKEVIVDDTLQPFVQEIRDLQTKIHNLEQLNQALQELNDI